MGLVNATNGNISAKYEYGPFGEVFCSVGDMAKVNPFGFSTKYTDNETDLLHYGYRYYSPALGRWMSRDPIEEQGGLNLYGFVNNDPVNKWDKDGREVFESITIKRKKILWLSLLKSKIGKTSAPDDPYGHWWFEFDNESYGWWPKDGVSLFETLTGVPGQLNGTDRMYESGISTGNRDGHHGDVGDVEFHPKRKNRGKLKYGTAIGTPCGCVTEFQVKDCLRKFAQNYSGKWSYPWGNNCHSFQRAAMRDCCIKK
jgi:RHS repeat-associated protein